MPASSETTDNYANTSDGVNTLTALVGGSTVTPYSSRGSFEAVAEADSPDRVRRLLEALPGGVIVLDRDGYVEECNPAARRITGCNLHACRWRDVVAQIVVPRADDHCDLSLANGRRVNITTCSLGGTPGQVLLINDVTETRDLQDKVANVRRLSEMGAMMAAIAHQIRTPLSTALLYATAAGPKASPQSIAKLVERLRHLDKLVTDMLCFARQGAMRVEELSARGLLHVFRSCVAGDELQTDVVGACGELLEDRILGNTDTLQSVFQNLVNNARQATEPAALVLSLSMSRPSPGWLRISIADNGPGIAPALGERVFEPFVSSREQGTGLGLSVARRLVESHGGYLNLDAGRPGGATFHMDLPTLSEDDSATSQAESFESRHLRVKR